VAKLDSSLFGCDWLVAAFGDGVSRKFVTCSWLAKISCYSGDDAVFNAFVGRLVGGEA